MKKTQDFSIDSKFYDKVRSTIPKSDPIIYNKIVNMLTVALTKSGIKTKEDEEKLKEIILNNTKIDKTKLSFEN